MSFTPVLLRIGVETLGIYLSPVIDRKLYKERKQFKKTLRRFSLD